MRKQNFKIIMVGLVSAVMMLSMRVYAEEDLLEDMSNEIIYEEPSAPDKEIIFNPDLAVNKTAAKSALADMHGIYVFRSAFITRERIVKERERKLLNDISDTVLNSEQSEADFDIWVNVVLISDGDRYVREINTVSDTDNTVFMWICCAVISICMLCLAFVVEINLKRKHQEDVKNGGADIEQYVGSAERK